MGGYTDPNEITIKETLQSLLRFLRSMRFSFVLLFAIIAACIAGSVKPGVFTSWWFLLLAGLLCLNLILCSVSRFPAILKAWKASGKKSIGMWGSWITHLGMLLLITGFVAGQYTSKEESFYGIAGSSQPVGNSGLFAAIDSFEVKIREDNTVEQYTAGLTISNAGGISKSGSASVNHPFEAFGYSFYQDSMGWATYVDIYKSEQPVKTDLICAGEYTFPDDHPGLVLMFNKFYPDLEKSENGGYISKTPLMNNPHSLYTVYHNGSVLGMGLAAPGTPVDAGDYRFVMRDPVEYTLIVAKKDPTVWLVGTSAVVLLIGLFISFYIRLWENRRTENNAEQ